MEIIFTRDSLHLSDDIYAPHKQLILINELSVNEVFNKINELEYIPKVARRSTWGIIGYSPTAIIVQQRNYSLETKSLFSDLHLEKEIQRTGNKLHLCYFGQNVF